MKTAEELLDVLRDILPSVAITVAIEADAVHVRAAAIVNGQVVSSYVGGARNGDLPQMILSALTNLPARCSVSAARMYLQRIMAERTIHVAWQDTPATDVQIAVNP